MRGPRRRQRADRASSPAPWPSSPATPPAASATRWARSSSSSPTPATRRSPPPTCWPCWAWPMPSSSSRRWTRSSPTIPPPPCAARPSSPRPAATRARSCATSRSTARELLAVKMLEEVPEELRVTPERDARLLTQAQALAGTDVVRLLDLVVGGAGGHRQRRPAADPARAGPHQGHRSGGRPVDRGAAGADRAPGGRAGGRAPRAQTGRRAGGGDRAGARADEVKRRRPGGVRRRARRPPRTGRRPPPAEPPPAAAEPAAAPRHSVQPARPSSPP